MFLLDLSHTSHTRARTGVQRVACSLYQSLGDGADPICFDQYLGAWRRLLDSERLGLDSSTVPAGRRGAHWPWSIRMAGRWRRWRGGELPREQRLPAGAIGAVLPEIFSPAVGAALPALRAAAGPIVAIFHDAIALQLPELSPPRTVARFPTYLQELLQCDGIAATSRATRESLLAYWQWLGVDRMPPVEAIPLGVVTPPAEVLRPLPASEPNPVILSVGTIEGRKNHVALLEACERLWQGGRKFQLHLVGLTQVQTGTAARDRIQALQAAGRPLRYSGPVEDATLHAAYAECRFTVYPSLREGFGLPVLESLAHGRPCICSGRGALGEAAAGGGCLTLDSMDAANLAEAIDRLLQDPTRVIALAEAARQRRFRTWAEHAADLSNWLQSISQGDGRAEPG